MNSIIEILACKLGEGFQSSSLNRSQHNINAFHRTVATHESSDLSFINGLISTGLRGSAIVGREKLISNYNQLLTASRQHLPLVVNTNARLASESDHSDINNYANIYAVQQTGCFQLVASSLQEEIYLTLIAHRIAELALIPGMVIADYQSSDSEVGLPADDLIRKYLGSPDDQIQCPTPAQEIIFGRSRRRIPNWYSLDLPVMFGAGKNGEEISFEAAASQKYFYAHLPQLIRQALDEFEEIIGANINPVTTKGNSSDFAIITIGSQVGDLFDDLSADAKNAEIISLNQLNPFPATAVNQLLKGKKSVTILENISGSDSGHTFFYYNVIHSLESSHIKIYSGKYSSALDVASLESAIDHMTRKQAKSDYHLGLNFTQTSGNYPKHNILLREIEKQYPDIAAASISSNRAQEYSASIVQDDVPMAIRMYRDHGPNYSRLSRFYDNTAFFYEHDESNELVADPFSAIPVVPAASASFFNQSSKRTSLPIFDTAKCTACGDCFVLCPHSALPPIAIGVEQLMRAGMDIAASKGLVITKLTPLIKNLAKVAAKSINETDVSTAQDFLPTAFESLTARMKLEGDKLSVIAKEFNAVLDEVGGMPVAITEPFFNLPDTIEKGRGELFSLAVNPNACTGCGICADVCDEDALTMVSQDSANLTIIKNQFKLWEQLPDTSGDTINRLLRDDKYRSLAAIMLSRNYTMAMSGASDSDPNSSYKTLLHIVTATAESVVQPKIIDQLKDIDALISANSESIHKIISKGLPKEDLEGLATSLKRARGRKISIQDLINQMPGQERGQLFDSEVLERKASLVEDLKNLYWVLSEGPTAVGRARFGMLVAGSNSMEWAKQYPVNNFTSPTVIQWNGSAPEQTLGLFYGQLRYLLDNIKLMRRGELESKDKYDPSVHDLEIAELAWDDLTDQEKQLIPPVLLIAERDDLNELGWSSLNKILAEKYPVKVFILDHITSPKNSPVAALSQINSGIFSSIALKNAFVFQGGIGSTDHLINGLLEGLDKSYPALFNLYATKFEKHGVANIDWSSYATLALNSRAFPCLSYDPRESSGFLNGAINLDGNKQNKQDWVQEEVAIPNQEAINYDITWADWAFTQDSWKKEFAPLDDTSSCVLLPEYIRLNAPARNGHVASILRADELGLKYYSVSDLVVEMTAAILSNWNTLQELAGLSTEFPVKLREEVTKELQEKYEKDVEELKSRFEQQFKEQEESQTEKLRQQLKEKLVALSRMAQSETKL
jgi:pyruvate/2-oxoacid:ferredoxin oxidoreductase alpha subunit/ferredoxin